MENLLRVIALGLLLGLVGCGSNTLKQATGKLACESFFIYDLCIHDLTGDGLVDYMYFDDTKEIFMFRPGYEDQVAAVMAMHRCAMPMTEPALRNSSELLYMEDRGLGSAMVLKGKLVSNYMQVKGQIDDCFYEDTESDQTPAAEEDDFFSEEWED